MTKAARFEPLENGLADWLVTALEGHMPTGQIQTKLVSRFGLTIDQALIAEESARDGIFLAISGSKRNMPDSKTDPIGHAAFSLVWDSFNQNSFFDKRHTPNRKWLDWKEQQKYRERD
jgi:hypothetical protein